MLTSVGDVGVAVIARKLMHLSIFVDWVNQRSDEKGDGYSADHTCGTAGLQSLCVDTIQYNTIQYSFNEA